MHKLNLLPEEILISQNKKKRNLFCILTANILLILLIFIVVSINNSIKFFESKILEAHQDITEMKSEMQNKNAVQKILSDFEKRQNFYDDTTKNKTKYYTILNNIINLVPKEINITSLSIVESNKIKINGYTPSHIFIALLMEDLKNIADVVDVLLGYTRLMDVKDEVKQDYNFEIIIELAKDR